MSEHSKGRMMDLYYENSLPDGSGCQGEIVDQGDNLVAAEVYGSTPGACDALGRKMAAAPELVEALTNLLTASGFDNAGEFRRAVRAAKAALKKAGVEP